MRAHALGCLAFLCFAAGCSGSSDDCLTTGTCDPAADGGAGDVMPGDAAPDVVVPEGCDLTRDLADSPACIDEGIGVFVDAAGGDDAGDGTRAHPFKTIGHAVASAGFKPRIYVCDGTYAEDVSLDGTTGVSLYGGLKCGDWSYDGQQPTVGQGTTSLRMKGVSKSVVIEDLSFVASNATTAGGLSIAALVTGCAGVTFRRVAFSAGTAMDGAAGTLTSNWSQVAQSDASIAGKNATGTSGGGAHACTLCADGTNSTGGAGGSGGLLTGSAGKDGVPSLGGKAPDDGTGGAAGCKAGDDGASAQDPTRGAGASRLGVLSKDGWAPGAGVAGKNGGPGQGGGGGGGTDSLSSGGGGGGACGGCGGGGGGPGGGGGGSIGLAVSASDVTLIASRLAATTAGKGGAGVAGQAGQPGGYGGDGASPGCNGGNGGTGGAGGAGGGGAGGVSVGVLYAGTKPSLDDATLQAISVAALGGSKGVGGAPGLDDGTPGVAQPVVELK